MLRGCQVVCCRGETSPVERDQLSPTVPAKVGRLEVYTILLPHFLGVGELVELPVGERLVIRLDLPTSDLVRGGEAHSPTLGDMSRSPIMEILTTLTTLGFDHPVPDPVAGAMCARAEFLDFGKALRMESQPKCLLDRREGHSSRLVIRMPGVSSS